MSKDAKIKDIDQYLEDVYSCTARRELDKALDLLDKAYSIDFDSKIMGELFKMLRFWKERWARLEDLASSYEKGDYLMNQWDQFLLWTEDRLTRRDDRGLQILKHMVHSASLTYYEQLNSDESDDQELCFRIGRCNKILGNYEKAASFLEKGARINKENPLVLAELADTYALMDEMKGAKIFFREAFFINPQDIDLARLESGLIKKVIDKIQTTGLSNSMLSEWLPVYAVIYGVFNVKRELRPIEYGKLRQSIYSLQSDIRQDSEDEVLVPRLINRYFWLIDHYISIKEDRSTIDEVLMNIKLLSPSIYQQYIN
ncbi:MAG: hypothetical protein B6241_07125 [Spirochaetaceae bacterium 4572_59]|nr:MAG: hypothetical protein B6241_07125 [Spirochaetaceae bacterium 4572_59]